MKNNLKIFLICFDENIKYSFLNNQYKIFNPEKYQK